MNRGQRVAHRRAFALLAVALPAFLVAALCARPAELPGLEAARAPAGSAALAGRTPRIVRTGERVSVLLPPGWNEPDVLLYASAGPADAAAGLPADARLVGSLAGSRTFPWPARTGPVALLYSLAQDRVLLAAEPEEGP